MFFRVGYAHKIDTDFLVKGIVPRTMKTLTINGVPYLVNEKGDVFVYSSVPPIQIGTYNDKTKVLSLEDDWASRMKDWVAYYRTGLKETTRDALDKARQLQQAT